MTTQTFTATGTTSGGRDAARRPTGPRGRAGRVALWVLQVLTAAVFLNGAVLKLTGSMGSPEAFAEMGLGAPGMYLVGAAELAGGIGLLVPRLAGTAALGLVALMTGAVVIEGVTHGPAMMVPPFAALVCVALLARCRRDSTAELVRRLRGRR